MMFLVMFLPLLTWAQDNNVKATHGLTIYSSALITWENADPAGYDFTPGFQSGFINPMKVGDLLVLKEGGYLQTWNPLDTSVFKCSYIGISSGGTIIPHLDIAGGIRVWKEIQGNGMGIGATFKLLIFAPISERIHLTTVVELWARPVWGGSVGIGVTYTLKGKSPSRSREKPPG